MNLNTDSNKGINIKGEDFSKSDTKSLGSNKETNLDIKTGNNNQTGMNGNMSASGNGKNNGQSLDISGMDIETLGDEPVEATMKNTNVGKSQTINTDKGGFKSIHSETVEVTEKDMEDTGGFLGGVVSFFTGLAEDVGDAVSGWAEDVSAWWNEEASPVLQDISNTIGDFLIDTGAALVTGVISIGEGLLSFGEAIVDTGALLLTGIASVGTGIFDLGQALYGLVTGEEWESVTKQMWEGTQGFVATEHVKSWFDGFYENTEVGRFLKENANLFGLVDFDTIRSVGSGIGYTIGVVALTVLTFGVGGAAVSGSSATVSAAQLATTAGVAGFGRGTESAWKDGANLGEGLLFGGLNGVWEGFQFYIGGKIAGFGNAGNTFLGHSMKGFENKALNALTRVILDGADGGLEGFAQPLMATVYKDGYTTPEGEYVEFTSDMNIVERATKLFDSYGGWGNVATQAFIGSAMSMVGEGFDLRRYLKEGQEAKVDSGLIDESKVQMSETDFDSLDTLDEPIKMNSAETQASATVSEVKPVSIENIEKIKRIWSDKILDTTTDLQQFQTALNQITALKNTYQPADLNSIKTQIVDTLVDSGKIKDLNNNYIFALARDPIMLERLIDTNLDSVTNLLTKNLERLPQLLVPIFKELPLEKFDTIFTNQNVVTYIQELPDESYSKIINQFNTKQVYKWLECKTLTDRLTTMPVLSFYNTMRGLNLYQDIKAAVEGGNSNVCSFLETIADKYYTKSILLSKEIVSNPQNRNILSLPFVFENQRYSNLRKSLEEVKASVEEEIITAAEKQISIPIVREGNILYIKDIMPNSYYKILVENNGIEKWIDTDSISGKINLYGIISNNNREILEGTFKIKDIVRDDLKSNLVVTSNQGLAKGMNACQAIIDGKPTTIIFNSYSDSTYSLNYKVHPTKSAEVISVKSIASQNKIVDKLGDVYEITYKTNGDIKKVYLEPSKPNSLSTIKEPLLDIDSWIIEKQIPDFQLENIKIISGEEISAKIHENSKYSHVPELFSAEKYGGNQSDVSNIVNRVIEKIKKVEPLDLVEQTKFTNFSNIAKKYFPNLKEVDFVSLADKYSNCGCLYMAIANAFSTYSLKSSNGSNWFKDKVGFDISFSANGKNYYNTDVLAWDMFLNYWSKKTNGNVTATIKNSEGISKLILDDFLMTYFSDKGISVKSKVNSNLLEEILNSSPDSYNILSAIMFDLELLKGIDDSQHITDKALANSSTEGKIRKGVGGHGMLITDVDSNNNIIVSSWSKKFKFLEDSIETYRKAGNKASAEIINIEFIPETTKILDNISNQHIKNLNQNINEPEAIVMESPGFFKGNQETITQVLKNNNYLQSQLGNMRTVLNNIEYKYPGEGLKRIEKYLMDGNITHITRSYGCRDYIQAFSKSDITKMLNMIIDTDNIHSKISIPNNLTPMEAQTMYKTIYDSIASSQDYTEYMNYVNFCKQQGVPYFYNYQFLEIENQLKQLLNQFSFQKKYFSLKTNNEIFKYFGNIGDNLFPKLISEVEKMSSLSSTSTPISAYDLSQIKDINYLEYIFANPSKNIKNYLTSLGYSNNHVSAWDKNGIINYIKSSQQGQFLSKLTVGEVLAVYEYTCGSGTILKYLTGHPIDNHFRIKDPYILNTIINGLDSAIKKFGGLKNNMILYRGDTFDKLSLWKGWNVSKPSDLLQYIGKTIPCETYMSTGVSQSGSFSGPVKWIIKAPVGTQGMYINDISKYFSDDIEFEYIVNRGSKFRIDDVYYKNGTTYIKAKIVE